jgi:DNA-binding winged helix-turn-helix (wHTH) protein
MQVRFDEFTVDTASRQLRRGDAEQHLSPKAFDFLCLLLVNRPRVLSKAELHERLWPSTFVSDAALTTLVAEVRAALGETAGGGRFVRTVHRYGYAFKAPATELGDVATSSEDRARCWILWQWGRVPLTDGDHLLGPSAAIEDLGSKNGTFLRGERLSAPAPLADGDEISVGSVLIRFRRIESGTATATQVK